MILGYALLVGSRSFWFHAIGAGSIALVIGFSLVVLLDLSYPFAGGFASIRAHSGPESTHSSPCLRGNAAAARVGLGPLMPS